MDYSEAKEHRTVGTSLSRTAEIVQIIGTMPKTYPLATMKRKQGSDLFVLQREQKPESTFKYKRAGLGVIEERMQLGDRALLTTDKNK